MFSLAGRCQGLCGFLQSRPVSRSAVRAPDALPFLAPDRRSGSIGGLPGFPSATSQTLGRVPNHAPEGLSLPRESRTVRKPCRHHYRVRAGSGELGRACLQNGKHSRNRSCCSAQPFYAFEGQRIRSIIFLGKCTPRPQVNPAGIEVPPCPILLARSRPERTTCFGRLLLEVNHFDQTPPVHEPLRFRMTVLRDLELITPIRRRQLG